MDITAILAQFSSLPVIVLPVLLVVGGSIVWLMIVDRFFGTPRVEEVELDELTAVEEPVVLIATPVKDEAAAEERPELVVVPEPIPARGYDRFGASSKL